MCCNGVFGCLAEGYNSNLYPWWEAVIMLRKLALQCIAVLFSDLFMQGGLLASASWIDG